MNRELSDGPSLVARVATWLETTCRVAVQLAIPELVILVVGGLTYAIGGWLALLSGLYSPSYPFLALNADPVFNLFGTVIGLVICQGTGTIIVLALMESLELEKRRNQIALLWAFFGFGSGAGLIRLTVDVTLPFLTHIL